MRRSTGFVLSLALLAFVPIARADAPPPPRTAADAVTPIASRRGPERHAEFMNRIKQGDIDVVLLGDSITDFWPRRGEHSWTKLAPFLPRQLRHQRRAHRAPPLADHER